MQETANSDMNDIWKRYETYMTNEEQFVKDIKEMLYWARRYCDGRSTYAPSSFNDLYVRFVQLFPLLKELDKNKDTTLMNDGEFFPYAQDGMYDPVSGHFDARPGKHMKTISK